MEEVQVKHSLRLNQIVLHPSPFVFICALRGSAFAAKTPCSWRNKMLRTKLRGLAGVSRAILCWDLCRRYARAADLHAYCRQNASQ